MAKRKGRAKRNFGPDVAALGNVIGHFQPTKRLADNIYGVEMGNVARLLCFSIDHSCFDFIDFCHRTDSPAIFAAASYSPNVGIGIKTDVFFDKKAWQKL